MGGSVSDPWQIGSAHAGYFDNLGDLAVDGVWETRYGITGLALQPWAGLEAIVQFLYGTTTTRGAGLASTIAAVYPIVSYRWRSHRLSFRYDDFRVRDDDGGADTSESGHAFTSRLSGSTPRPDHRASPLPARDPARATRLPRRSDRSPRPADRGEQSPF